MVGRGGRREVRGRGVSSRDIWKSRDRERPPCPNCGTELYDQFWGNGGWAAADKATDKFHNERDCIRVLKARNAALEAKTRD